MELLLILALSAVVAGLVWANTHTSPVRDDYSSEPTPIADQLDWDFGVMEKLSARELIEYIKARM